MPAHPEVVLLVEDDETLRGLYAQALEARGYKVLQAGDGFEALIAAATHPEGIHLLITDFLLPRMSGQELWLKFRTHHPAARALFLSGHIEQARPVVGDGPDAPRLLAKPVGAETLVATVRMCLDAAHEGRSA